jgi:hypothetical protein
VCDQQHFFASAEATAGWLNERPGATVVSVRDGLELGRALVTRWLKTRPGAELTGANRIHTMKSSEPPQLPTKSGLDPPFAGFRGVGSTRKGCRRSAPATPVSRRTSAARADSQTRC